MKIIMIILASFIIPLSSSMATAEEMIEVDGLQSIPDILSPLYEVSRDLEEAIRIRNWPEAEKQIIAFHGIRTQCIQFLRKKFVGRTIYECSENGLSNDVPFPIIKLAQDLEQDFVRESQRDHPSILKYYEISEIPGEEESTSLIERILYGLDLMQCNSQSSAIRCCNSITALSKISRRRTYYSCGEINPLLVCNGKVADTCTSINKPDGYNFEDKAEISHGYSDKAIRDRLFADANRKANKLYGALFRVYGEEELSRENKEIFYLTNHNKIKLSRIAINTDDNNYNTVFDTDEIVGLLDIKALSIQRYTQPFGLDFSYSGFLSDGKMSWEDPVPDEQKIENMKFFLNESTAQRLSEVAIKEFPSADRIEISNIWFTRGRELSIRDSMLQEFQELLNSDASTSEVAEQWRKWYREQ